MGPRMRRFPSLPALLTFETAARLGSFKRAAEELGVTPTAVSHQIRALEQQLGLRLFYRETRHVRLTEPGASLHLGVAEGFEAIALALARAGRANRRRTLTITATSAFSSKWLVPRLAKRHDLIEDIDIRLFTSDDVVDLHRADVDLAIRYGLGRYPGLDSTLLIADQFAPVAHPRLGIESIEDLAFAPIIRFDWRNPHPAQPTWEKWFGDNGIVRDARAPEYSFSDESHAIQATIAGQGVALLSVVLLHDELASGIIRRLPGGMSGGLAYYLVHKPSKREALPVVGVEQLKRWLISEAESTMLTGGSTS